LKRVFVKSLLTIILLIFLASIRVVFSQVNPIKVEIYTNGNKLGAKFFSVDKTFSPTVILIHEK